MRKSPKRATGKSFFPGPGSAALLLICIPFTAPADELKMCGSLDNAYGPYDYTNPQHRRDRLPIVEAGHFNSDVENLIKGMTGRVEGDLDYTLRAFPNHPRALWSMARLHLREKTTHLGGATYSIDCWFDRAMRFNPNDPTVRYIYGMYLHRSGEIELALEQYKVALQLNDENAEIHYNIALLYLERNELELATTHARRAYSMGFPLPGLKRKLREKGIDIS
mgnify:CR=1 FL=1